MANDRVISISGIVFAIATFAGLMLLLSGTAAGSTTNLEAAEWLTKNAHRTRMIIGMYVMCGGAIAFLVFATCLLQRLRDAEAPSLAINVAQWAGVAFVILAMAAAVGMASGAYAAISDIEPGAEINSDAVRVSTFGFALWVIPAASRALRSLRRYRLRRLRAVRFRSGSD